MKSIHHIVNIACIAILTLISCKKSALSTAPKEAIATIDTIEIYPDYKEVTIPYNIAPMNFQLTEPSGDARVQIVGNIKPNSFTVKADPEGAFDLPEKEWKALLEANKGGKIQYTLFVLKENKWTQYPSFSQQIANDPIDRALSYRLIEPGYEIYRQLGIYQRDLETFTQKPIYLNNRQYEKKENHCVNCHTYQNYDSKRMLFHIRHTYGGTLLIDQNEYEKINLKTDSTIGSGVYPAWHPTLNTIVFSVNKTGQLFFTDSNAKIEVIDTQSDLIYFDVAKNTVKSLGQTPNIFETFPTWSADGTYLYYCAAELPNDTAFLNKVPANFDKIHYNLMRRSFDPKTQTFGAIETIINAAKDSLSITLPRVSPDGKYLMFTIGKFGQFHIWHKESDLGLMNLTTGEIIALDMINSDDAESWHSWSSNGRWFTFSSRREDGSFTRPYFAYFDLKGTPHKPFLLPQKRPFQNKILPLSYNLPTLTKEPIPYSQEEVTKQVRKLEAKPTQYGGVMK